ncbi:MAG TPA: homoserine kinase [Streptosporangiaceae bacterium]|nr:homoserine kinase [Streptosporangiaceae bacterium]
MTWPDRAALVRVPATSANVGPGFDSFGLALGLYDVLEARVTGAGLGIEVTGVGEHTANSGEGHLVARAMRAAFDVLGVSPPGLALRCRNAIPHGFGFGSSAAAIVAGLLAARELGAPVSGTRLSDEAVLGLAAGLEGHADNVAACLYGGFVIAWSPAGRNGDVRFARLEPVAGLTPVLCVPTSPLATEVARSLLPVSVPHADAAMNAGRAGLLVAGLISDPALLLDASEDFLHQPYRAESMPGTAGLVSTLRLAGVPAVVSGAGPAVLALVVPGVTAGVDVVSEIAKAAGEPWDVLVLEVDRAGGSVVTAPESGV